MTLRAIAPHALTIGLCCVIAHVSATTVVPMQTPKFAQSKLEIDARTWMPTDLTYGFGNHVRAGATGNYQHFEVDTFLHSGSKAAYVFNGIFTVMAEGGSYAREVRSIGGADIRGTVDKFNGCSPCHVEVHDAGRINASTCYEASYGGDAFGEKRSFVDTDHASRHTLAGTTDQIDRLVFSNGWSLQVNGDSLELHDARGIVQIFR